MGRKPLHPADAKASAPALHRPAPAQPGGISTWLLIPLPVHPGTQLNGTTASAQS